MDLSGKKHQYKQENTAMETVGNGGQMAYVSPLYGAAPPIVSGSLAVAVPPQTHQYSYQPVQQFHYNHHQQQQQLEIFWANQVQEIEQTTDFKNHSLPLARIKKIMKADEEVQMISAEAPVIFAKACEMFISELTLRSWIHTEENKRKTLQKNDIAAAIAKTDMFDFLVDTIPRDELREEGLGINRGPIPDIPYYYVPSHPEMIMGKSIDQHNQPPIAFMPWPHTQALEQPSQQGK